MSKIKMHKCYRCKSKKVAVYEKWENDYRYSYVSCNECDLQTGLKSTEELAIKSWNKCPDCQKSHFTGESNDS